MLSFVRLNIVQGNFVVNTRVYSCFRKYFKELKQRISFFVGEGDAYGASLRQISTRPRAVVSLRASTCVDCHVIKLKNLEDVMTSYPNLRAQLLSMMDAADQNDLYEEVTLQSNLFLLLYLFTLTFCYRNPHC